MVSVQHLLDWLDGVEQTAVALEAIPGVYHCVLRTDETFVSEGADVFAHCVDAHSCRRSDGLVAGPALMGAPVLTAEQIRVHGELSGR